jgi:hypothetical protein
LAIEDEVAAVAVPVIPILGSLFSDSNTFKSKELLQIVGVGPFSESRLNFDPQMFPTLKNV